MRITIHLLQLLLLVIMGHPSFCQRNHVETKGIYGHPQKLWEKGYRLNELGINAVFLHHQSIDDTFMARARKEGQKVYAEFAALNGEDYVQQHPEAWAIDKRGNKVEKATWFMGVCPTDPNFLQYRLDQLKTLVTTYDVDGVWLDYLHWHAQFEDPEPILPETCFNASCVTAFQAAAGLDIPEVSTAEQASYILANHEDAWRQWRCSVIADWVKKCSTTLRQHKPGAQLGIYHCPWNDDEYDSARIRILALDYAMLKPHVDVFSPMVYHKRMGRDARWVRDNINWFSEKINDATVKIWPIVQAYNDPGIVSPEAFEQVMRYAISGSSTGVMMFTSSAIAEDDRKIEVIKKLYGAW